MISIYGLQSQKDHRIRYVGQTAHQLHKRLKGHIQAAKRGSSPVAEWVLSQHHNGTLDIVLIRAVSADIADAYEKSVISALRETNDLLNVRDGGRFRPTGCRLLRPICVEHDDNGTLLITCPSLPEVVTYATGVGKIVARANDAIEVALLARQSVED